MKLLPAELGACKLLEELIVSENALLELPAELGALPALRVLRAQNNEITVMAPEIGDCLGLTEVDVSYNPLANVPEDVRKNAVMVTWLLRTHKHHRDEVRGYVKASEEMELHARRAEIAKAETEAQLSEVNYKYDLLIKQTQKKGFMKEISAVCTLS